jgi:hypothetical protein
MTVHSMQNLREYCRDLYLGLSSKDGSIAVEYLEALTNGDGALRMFCEKFSDPCPEHEDDIAREAAQAVEESDAREGRDFRKKGRA